MMMKEKTHEEAYREYIESAESLEALLDAEEVELKMPAPEDKESRVTVRLKDDDIKLIDKMCDVLGVGRSTFLKMAARIVALSALSGMKEYSFLPLFEAAASSEEEQKPA
jgi:uncharacterized protein (DUF1778 family)